MPQAERISYEASLRVLTPLHIGSGRNTTRDGVTADVLDGTAQSKRFVPIAAIQRDVRGQPFIPGSALKGALLEVARGIRPEDTDEAARHDALVIGLFGSAHIGKERDAEASAVERGSGEIGALTSTCAWWALSGPLEGLPFGAKSTFIQARAAIDRGRGTAQVNRLFHREMVAAGTVFTWSFQLKTRKDISKLEELLAKLLAAFSGERGLNVASGKSADMGRIGIEGSVARAVWRIEDGCQVKTAPLPWSLPQAEPHSPVEVTLTCDGPYLTRDSGWTDEVREAAKTDADPHPPNIRALRQAQKPVLWGTAVKGALRTRSEWLYACKLKGSATEAAWLEGNAPRPDKTPVERLFGTPDWKGLLSVGVRSINRTNAFDGAQVRLDRFSAGTIDNALFRVDADYGISLRVLLALDRRAEDSDQTEFEQLLSDLRANGLELGHGVSRGYGWFRMGVD